jgi:hypothetical protein
VTYITARHQFVAKRSMQRSSLCVVRVVAGWDLCSQILDASLAQRKRFLEDVLEEGHRPDTRMLAS